MAEYRISIYGRKMSEWDQMASWIVNNELYSENVVWLIQVLSRICISESIFFSCCFTYLFFFGLGRREGGKGVWCGVGSLPAGLCLKKLVIWGSRRKVVQIVGRKGYELLDYTRLLGKLEL